MAATMNAVTFMGKDSSPIQSFIKNYEDLTLKQMFDVTAQLVNNQDEIHGLNKIQWEKYSWTRLSLIGDETVINLQSTNIYGAVAAMCEEFENHQDGSGGPEILMGQSIVLSEIKAEVPLQNENPLNHQILWQQYIERIESLSPESKVGRFCKEAGFMRVVEVGQYFITKNTGDLRQFRSVACRENTLPRDDPASQPKVWIQGNMRIGPVLEVTTSFENFKKRIEIGSWSVG